MKGRRRTCAREVSGLGRCAVDAATSGSPFEAPCAIEQRCQKLTHTQMNLVSEGERDMLVLHGIYEFGKKQIGFMQGYCDICNSVSIFGRVRFFPFFHVFFIPLVPLGIVSELHCHVCNGAPTELPSPDMSILLAS